jgi:uncharacterized protein (TIGR03437 family)
LVNAVIPYGINTSTTLQLLIERGTTISIPVQLDSAPADPIMLAGGIYDDPQDGTAPFPIGSTHPAHVGDQITIYCVGLGAVSPSVADGSTPTSLTIGGQPASISFAGLSSSLPGLYQVIAVVPQGVPTGTAVPVVLTVGGQTSPAITISIQ